MNKGKLSYWSCILQPNERVERILRQQLASADLADIANRVYMTAIRFLLFNWEKMDVLKRLSAEQHARLHSRIEAAELDKNKERVLQEACEVAESLAAEDRGNILIVKGVDAETYYGDLKYLRLYHDIDVVCRDADTAFRLMNAYRQHGYILEKLRFERVSPLGKTCAFPYDSGVIILHHNSAPRSLDLHIGQFPGFAQIPLSADVFDRARVGSGGYLFPSMEDGLLISIVHAARHTFFPVRVLNDLFMMLQNLPHPLDIGYIVRCSEQSGVSGYVRVAAQLLLDLYALNDAARESVLSLLASIPNHWSNEILRWAPGVRIRKETNPFAYPLQTRMLFQHARQTRLPVAATLETLRCMLRMVLQERPYRVWGKTNVPLFGGRESRCVLADLSPSAFISGDNTQETNALVDAGQAANLQVRAYGNRCVVVRDNQGTEVVFLPCGTFVTTSYSGGTSETLLAQGNRILRSLKTYPRE